MSALFHRLMIFVISFTLVHVEMVPMRQEGKRHQSLSQSWSLNLLPSSAQAQEEEPPCYEDEDQAKAAGGKVCQTGTYALKKGTARWIGFEEWWSFILLLAVAVTTMFMIVGCRVTGSFCGYAGWAAGIGGLALLVGEIISTVKQKTIYEEIEYNYTQLRKNGSQCATDSSVDGCEQLAALQSQHEALDKLHKTLLIKIILYGAGVAAYLIAMIIELAANQADYAQYQATRTALLALNNGAIRLGCSEACAKDLAAAGACVARVNACAVGVDAAIAQMEAVEAIVAPPVATGPSGPQCQTIRAELTGICPTALTPTSMLAPVSVCRGNASNPARIACSPAMGDCPGVEPALAQVENYVETMRCTVASAGSILANTYTLSIGWSSGISLGVTAGPPTPTCKFGCDWQATVTMNDQPTMFMNDAKVAHQTETDLNKALSELTGIFDLVMPVANAASDDAKKESWVSKHAPWLKGFGFGATAILLIAGLIWMAKRSGDMFFARPATRAIFYGVLSGIAAIALGTTIKTRIEVGKQRDKLAQLISQLTTFVQASNTTTGVVSISTIPQGGFSLEGLDGESTDVPTAPKAPCPFGGDGKGNCLQTAQISETSLVNTPFGGMAGLANSMSALHNDTAGRKGISSKGLGEANKLAGAINGLRKKADMMKKNFNDMLAKNGQKTIPFDSLEKNAAAALFKSAKNIIDKEKATPDMFGGGGEINKQLMEKMPEEAKADLAKTAVAPTQTNDPFGGMNFEEANSAASDNIDVNTGMAKAMEEMGLDAEDISNNEHANIFEAISFRYKKTAYPILFQELNATK